MSFILDALKKSETERQRADTPALYEMKVAPPRRGVAVWVLVLGALLLINIVVLAVVLLRGGHAPATLADAGGVPPPAVPAPATTAIAPTAPSPAIQSTVSVPPAAVDNAAALEQTPGNTPAGHPTEDDAPAVEPARAADTTAAPATRSAPVQRDDVQTYEQAAATAGANLPDLKLDLHSYAPNPDERFIFLNMTKLKEGQSTPSGVRVEAITPDGAVLSWQGNRFFLRPR